MRTNLHTWLYILGLEANYILYQQNGVSRDDTSRWMTVLYRGM